MICVIKNNPTLILSFYEQISSDADGDNKNRESHNYDLLLATEVASFMK